MDVYKNCEVTGNPFGMDTWSGYWNGSKWEGHACPCKNCSDMMDLWSAQLEKLCYFTEVVVSTDGIAGAPKGAAGITLGLAPPVSPGEDWVYAVYLKDTEQCIMAPYKSLLATGKVGSYEEFYGQAPRIRDEDWHIPGA